MKKPGSNCDYIQSRNENLKREFLKRLGKTKITRIFEEIARDAEADRFYISEEQAVRELRRVTPKPVKSLESRARMLADIRRRVDILMAFNPSMTLKEAVFRVVNSPAPGFYLTPKSIRTILYKTFSA